MFFINLYLFPRFFVWSLRYVWLGYCDNHSKALLTLVGRVSTYCSVLISWFGGWEGVMATLFQILRMFEKCSFLISEWQGEKCSISFNIFTTILKIDIFSPKFHIFLRHKLDECYQITWLRNRKLSVRIK